MNQVISYHIPAGADAGAGSDATYAETSSSFSTKQVVGYFWPVELLKKHSKQLPKRLSSLTHQGRVLKGVTLEEFAVGYSVKVIQFCFLVCLVRLYFVLFGVFWPGH